MLTLLPFSNKPFNIDDITFIWSAEHIFSDVLRPFAASRNWYGTTDPLYTHINHPPLNAYYLAALASIFGWKELPIHIGYILPAVALTTGTGYLAHTMGVSVMLSALMTLFTPVVLVSSTTIMADTMMAAFWVWSIVFWIRGLREDQSEKLLVASLLACVCNLCKFHGIALVPLLLVFSLFSKRRIGHCTVYLTIPIFVFFAYQLLAHYLYGHVPILDAITYTASERNSSGIVRVTSTLNFLGGGTIILFLLLPALWPRRIVVGWIVLLFVSATFFQLFGQYGPYSVPVSPTQRVFWTAHMAVFLTAGIHILFLIITDLLKNRDAIAVLLFLWSFGILYFTAFINWSINCRSLLLLVPAVVIIVVRRLEMLQVQLRDANRMFTIASLIAGGFVGLIVAEADAQWAKHVRIATQIIHNRFQAVDRELWFQGHWGFQYYMEKLGHNAFDRMDSRLRRGDIMVIPENNYAKFLFSPDHVALVDRISLKTNSHVRTMNMETGAGFYSDVVGPFPYTVGPSPPELYTILRVTKNMTFGEAR